MASAAPSVIPSSNKGVQYVETFRDLNASVSTSNYMGQYVLTSYNYTECAGHCDGAQGCMAFNLFIERDPTRNPAKNDNETATPWGTYCPDPPSTTNYRCTLWGVPVNSTLATNRGQSRADFQVVITGSDAWNITKTS